jgi:Na+-transporting NADH:ubiquinone oxidoreductase subunit NqrE
MAPSLNLFLAAIVCGFGAGLGWFTASWLVNVITARLKAPVSA